MKVLCLGHATWDIVIPLEQFPVENTKNRIKNCIECGGGPSSNAAYVLGKWGVDVSFAGVVGNDEKGIKVQKEFIKDNVKIDYLELSDNHTTTSSYIIVNTSSGSRTSLAYHPSNLNMTLNDIPQKFDILLVDGQEPEMTNHYLDNNDVISVIDAGRCTEEVINLCHRMNYIVCSKDFAEDYTKTGCENLEEVFKIINYM